MEKITPILLFSHNYLVGSWESIIKEQLSLLMFSGLYKESTKIYYCAYSYDEDTFIKFTNLIKNFDCLDKVSIVRHKDNKFEHLTIQYLHNTVKQFDEEVYVLYFHSKGTHRDVANPEYFKNNTSWRKILEYFNIEEWETCVKNLSHSDTVGALYWINEAHEKWKYFYSGNFWWSKSSYLSLLPEIDVNGDRMEAEMWIGYRPHSWVNLYHTPSPTADHYNTYFDPKEYRKF
jgi:hypothetical protein